MTVQHASNPFLKFADCASCPLNDGKKLMAAPKGQTDVVVVSQAPIMADILADDPFDSRGGRLVKGLMKHIGVTSWQGTYAVLCHHPDKSPDALSIAACRERLFAQVKACHPKVVVAMGDVAIKALFRTKAGQPSMRGMPQWSAELQAYILPTHHPRFAMEQPTAFYDVATDFNKIPDLIHRSPGEPFVKPETRHVVIDDEDKAIEACKFMRQFKVIAADIETKGFNWRHDKIICVGFAWKKGLTLIFDKNICNSLKVRPYLKELFEDPNIEWTWQNGKFDVKFWRSQHGIRARVDYDTMLAHYCLNERRGTHDLEQLATEYLYADPYEYKLDPYKKLPTFHDYEDIPKPVLHLYLGKDVDYTFRLREVFEPEFARQVANGRTKLPYLFHDLMMPAVDSFVEIEMAGMQVDQPYATELDEYFKPLLEEHLTLLRQYADELGWDMKAYAKWWSNVAMLKWQKEGKRKGKKPPNPTKPPKDGLFNPNSHQQLKYVMYELLKLPLYKKEMTADKDARKWYMENCEMPVPFISRLDKFKKDSKAYSTYVVGLSKLVWQDDSKIHATFNIHGTETGRTSSSDPNVHNIPRDSRIKNLFVAEPPDELDEELGEWIIVQADYSQAELRVLAVLGGSPWLRGVYYRGEDLHDAVSLQLYGPNFTKEDRVRAKAVNFGIPYGRTEYTLADEHHMKISEARKLINDWFGPQPETKQFMDARRSEPLTGIVYTTPTGRQRFYGLVTDHNKRAIQNEAGNFPIQGTASDCTIASINKIVPASHTLDIMINGKPYQVFKLINSVHDSIIGQVRAKFLPQAAEIMNTIMTTVPGQLLNTDMPFRADFEVGYRWGELKGYDYTTNTVHWDQKQADGSKVPMTCSLDDFRRVHGKVKELIK